MEEIDIMTLFDQYKLVCQDKLDSCHTAKEKEKISELLMSELLEQNELLIKTVVELQTEAKNRSIEMEKRLALSANKTEEVVLGLNNYELDIKKLVNDRVTQVESSDIIDELNSHIVAVSVENNYLREQNDNLKHDLNNLIEMMKRKITDDSSQDTKTECLTFCDVDPEDIFGPIESIAITNGSLVDEEVQVEFDNTLSSPPMSNTKVEFDNTLSSPPMSNTNNSADISNTNNSDNISNTNSTNSNSFNKFLVEEKQVLITKLQEHLQTISKELELKDELVKKLEIKLNRTRKDNFENKLIIQDLIKKNQLCDTKLKEANERISVLNDQKQSLMIQLDEESEQRIKFKEELIVLNSKLEENMNTVEQQSTIIQHLRNVIVNKCKSDSTQLNGNISFSSQQNL